MWNTGLTLSMQRHLLTAEQDTTRQVGRLSSGRRVQTARDDAAGLGIAERMDVNVRAAATVTRNVMDGISLVQVADGGLESIQSTLQRARELAAQAANGTWSRDDRTKLETEYQQLLAHVDQVANGTQAFGTHLLMGPQTVGRTPSVTDVFGSTSGRSVTMASGIRPVAFIPAGAVNVRVDVDSYSADDDLQLFARDGSHLIGTATGDVVWQRNGVQDSASLAAQVFTADNGFLPSAADPGPPQLDGSAAYGPAALPLTLSRNGMTITYSGDGDRHDHVPNDGLVDGGAQQEAVHIDRTTEPLLLMVVGSGVFSATASWDAMPAQRFLPPLPPGIGPVEVTVQADQGSGPQTLSIAQQPADSATLGITATTLTSPDAARAAMDALSTAIDRVSGYRADLGATSARFDAVIDNLATASQSQRAAEGRIVDADMAESSAALARSQIVANAAQALLAQANQSSEDTLRVLLDSGAAGAPR